MSPYVTWNADGRRRCRLIEGQLAPGDLGAVERQGRRLRVSEQRLAGGEVGVRRDDRDPVVELHAQRLVLKHQASRSCRAGFAGCCPHRRIGTRWLLDGQRGDGAVGGLPPHRGRVAPRGAGRSLVSALPLGGSLRRCRRHPPHLRRRPLPPDLPAQLRAGLPGHARPLPVGPRGQRRPRHLDPLSARAHLPRARRRRRSPPLVRQPDRARRQGVRLLHHREPGRVPGGQRRGRPAGLSGAPRQPGRHPPAPTTKTSASPTTRSAPTST